MSDLAANLIEWWWLGLYAVSVQAALLGLVVAVLERIILRWAPSRFVTPQLLSSLWLLVILRLLLPPSLTSPVGLPWISSGSATTSHDVLSWCWLAGCLACGATVIWRYRRARQHWLSGVSEPPRWLNQAAQKAAGMLGMRSVPAVALRPDALSPALVGIVRPVVILPTELVERLTRQQIEHVLLHELAHLRRHDPWWMVLLLCMRAVFWFHPLVWLACRRIAALREIACDAIASVAIDADQNAYRQTLLECARWALQPSAAAGLPLLGRGSQLLARLEWLKRARPQHVWKQRLLSLLICSLLFVATLPQTITSPIEQMVDLEPDHPPGCLVLRYQVMGMLAQQEQANR